MQDTAVLRVMRDGVVGHEGQAPPPHQVRAGRSFPARSLTVRVNQQAEFPKSLVSCSMVVHRDVMGVMQISAFKHMTCQGIVPPEEAHATGKVKSGSVDTCQIAKENSALFYNCRVHGNENYDITSSSADTWDILHISLARLLTPSLMPSSPHGFPVSMRK